MGFGDLILKNKRIFICFEDTREFPGLGREGLLQVRDQLSKSCLKHSEVNCEHRCNALAWTHVPLCALAVKCLSLALSA